MMKSSTILKTAHWSMAITFILSLVLLYLIYGIELNLSIPLLIFLHIMFILFAAVFKISYVARLTALKQMGKPVN